MGKSDSSSAAGINTYRCIIDTVPGLIVEVDENLVITLANRDTHKRWGSIIEGKTPIYELFAPGTGKPENGIIKRTFKLKKNQSGEIKTKGGEVLKIKTNYVNNGECQKAVVSMVDITDRVNLEKDFAVISREWHTTFDAISDPIALLDIDRKIMWCNRALEELAGKPFSSIVGHRVCQLIDHPDMEPTENCLFNQMKESHQKEAVTFLLGDRWFDIMVNPLFDDPGNIIGAVHVMNDITHRKKAEEEAQKHQDQLLQADKMISLGILASGMAHEINNPNNSIMLNVSVLQKAWDSIIPILNEFYKDKQDLRIGGIKYEKMKQKMPHLFSGILDSSKKIQRIVNDLKYFSGKDLISLKSQVDMESVVKSAISLTANMIQKSTHNFKAVYEKNLPNVMGNFQNLEQVIINLIQNACQALESPENGIFITITYDRERREIVTAVKDEGIGIPKKDLKHISEPFFTSKRSSGGTGLGLYVSSKIINDHGGTIHFFSEPGKGTTVEIRFPALDLSGQAPISPDAHTFWA